VLADDPKQCRHDVHLAPSLPDSKHGKGCASDSRRVDRAFMRVNGSADVQFEKKSPAGLQNAFPSMDSNT
jgi:hypothetical protein